MCARNISVETNQMCTAEHGHPSRPDLCIQEYTSPKNETVKSPQVLIGSIQRLPMQNGIQKQKLWWKKKKILPNLDQRLRLIPVFSSSSRVTLHSSPPKHTTHKSINESSRVTSVSLVNLRPVRAIAYARFDQSVLSLLALLTCLRVQSPNSFPRGAQLNRIGCLSKVRLFTNATN